MLERASFVLHNHGAVLLYFYVSIGYSFVNLLLALIILVRSRRNVLSKFYAFCVYSLVTVGLTGYLLGNPIVGIPLGFLQAVNAFLYSLFPFFFLHFMLIFVRRYEILKSKTIIFANYFAGLFSYTVVLLGFIPIPFTPEAGITPTGYIYYLTWMSIMFSIGVALLYSLIGGFGERGMKSNLLFVAFVLLMLLLPTPFTLSMFSIVSEHSFMLYFVSSTAALAVVVYIVFRHRITMNTPYQAMKSALEAMNDILIKTDLNFNIEMVQGAVLPLLGYSEQELVGRNLADLVQNKLHLEHYRTAVLHEATRSRSFDTKVVSKEGAALPMEFSFTPIYVNEEIIGFVGVGRDLSERKRAELLKESAYHIAEAADKAASLDELVRSVHEIINTVMSARNFYIALHDEQEDIITFPYFVDEVDESPVQPAKPGKGLTEYVLRTGKSLLCDQATHEALERSGECVLVGAPSLIWLGVPLVVERKTIGVMVVQHYTNPHAYGKQEQQMLEYVSTQVARSIERKRVEEALRASEERYRLFFEEDLTGDFNSTPNGRILACNPAFARIFGFSSVEEAEQASTVSLYPHPKLRESMLKVLKERKKLEYYEEELRRIDDKPVYVVENIIGKFDVQGNLVEIKTYVFDNTERRKLEDQLRQAQKLENLGTMAGGIAHDFNNILTIMSVHMSILKKMGVDSEDFRTSADAISRGVQRGAALVSQLLTFARKTDVIFESINVNHAVKELTRMVEATFPKTITFKLDLGKDIPTISADANQLNQVLLNLCVNARDAMPGGGQLTIRSEAVGGMTLRAKFPDARDETYVCISVSDTGIGMDEETRSRIFEPFFTTKEKGKGTGLGLAVVYGVLKSHHGFIDVVSEEGKGTTFHLYFHTPIRGIETAAPAEKEEEDIPGGTETILLVEDEELVLKVLTRFLTGKGYNVLTAQDGLEAVEVYKRENKKIAVVVTDLGLPKLGGWDAFLKMKAINPHVQGIFASGYIEPAVKSDMAAQGAKQFIQKPYVLDQILTKLREILDNHVH